MFCHDPVLNAFLENFQFSLDDLVRNDKWYTHSGITVKMAGLKRYASVSVMLNVKATGDEWGVWSGISSYNPLDGYELVVWNSDASQKFTTKINNGFALLEDLPAQGLGKILPRADWREYVTLDLLKLAETMPTRKANPNKPNINRSPLFNWWWTGSQGASMTLTVQLLPGADIGQNRFVFEVSHGTGLWEYDFGYRIRPLMEIHMSYVPIGAICNARPAR